MADPTYPLFPICAFLSFVFVLIPLPWHLQSWNSGTCLYMFWVALASLNLFINSIIWHNNILDSAPIWCDISTRIIVAVAVAIPAASLCINRRLYKIASCQTANITIAHKRRAVMVDLMIGLGIPAIQVPLQFVVQGHRYDIWEDIGCYPTTVNTPPAYPLSFVWPNIISLISGVYCILTLREFMKRRAQFNQFLSSNSSISVNRYFRLMCLATAELIFNIPISTYGLYLNITLRPIYVWKSWADTHFEWFIVEKYPAILWRSSIIMAATLELSRWSVVLCAVVFFGFFGFAQEARKHYRIAYWAVAKRFGIFPPPPSLVSSKVAPGLKAYGIMSKSSAPVSIPILTSNPGQTKRVSAPILNARSSFTKSQYSDTAQLSPISSDYKNDDMPLTPTTASTSSPSIYHVEPSKHTALNV